MKVSLSLMIPLGCLAALGCGAAGDQDSVSLKPTPFDSAAAKARELTAATEAAAADSTPDESEAATARSSEPQYVPPYPERDTLFSPPQRLSLASRSDNRDSSESVVLLGFADLEKPRALLSVENRIFPLAEGEESGGVTVISIAAPRVVLQRGATRWTVTIE